MESSESSESPTESPIDLPSPTGSRSARSARSSISEQTRSAAGRARRSKDGSSMRDVARILVTRERETADLKRAMYTLSEQLKAERQRADAAEAKTREVLTHFKNTNDAKIAAEQDAARANEGLRLYKLQYENAQEEIRRAQKLIDSLEAQRLDAEEAAAKARSTARKLKEEKVIMQAREEGRRLGMEEGMAQGRVMGYEEGRAAGFEHGRAAAEREFTSAPVTEMEYATPRAREYVPPQVSRPSTSEDSLPPVMPDYTQPMDTTEPIPPPVTTPARIPTPSETIPLEQPVPELRPISIRNSMFSPSHPAVDIPPEGWIPTLDGDNRIRLPPPHEMAPPPPTSPEPLSAVLNNVKNIPDEPVMIPPPSNPEASNRKVKHRRRKSTDSHSTTMSQFEILGPPTPAGTMPRGGTRDRPSVLSAIAEERERTSSASSPVYDMPNLSTQSFAMPVPSPTMPVPSPQPAPTPAVLPQNPIYPDTTPRYARSDENVARSGGDYYRTNTPGYGSEASYRSGSYGSRSQEQLRDREREQREQRERNMDRVRAEYERERERAEREHEDRERERARMMDRERIEQEKVARENAERAQDRERARQEREKAEREKAERKRAENQQQMERERAERQRVEHELRERERQQERERERERERVERDRERARSPYGAGDRYGDPTPRRHPSTHNIYAPPHSPHSSPDTPSSRTPAIVAPAPSLRYPRRNPVSENRGSVSSNEITFEVVPPSRPESNISVAQTEGVFLSADDADRPLPSVPETPVETAPAPSSPVIPPNTPLSGMSGPWPPPGFVPTGPPSPAMSSVVGPAGVPLPPSSYGGSTIGPAGVPLPPSMYGGTPSVRSEAVIPGGFPGSNDPPPVIPLQPSSRSSNSAGSSRKATEPYSRANIKRREEDSESSISSGLGSADSLTTPPIRTKKLSKSGRSTPAYAAAPIPMGVQYPVPPAPRSSTSNSLGSHTNRAARVPLPSSVSGSVVGGPTRPESAVGGPPPRPGSVVGGIRPPSTAGMDRPRSPMMGVRGLMSPNMQFGGLPIPEPVIPIPIPEPSPITQPVQILASPRRPTTPLADIEPTVIPSVARVPSPVASAVSSAPTNFTTTTKGKKGKKKR